MPPRLTWPKRESETAQLAAEHREMLPVLTAWSQADADLAEGCARLALRRAAAPWRPWSTN